MFRKPHPELEHYVPLAPHLTWLQSAFFRLHRRRRYSDMGGMQPISYGDMAQFAKEVLQIPDHIWPVFVRVIEETDNAVMHDHHAKRQRQETQKE